MKLLRHIILLNSIILLSVASSSAAAFSGFSAFQVRQQTDTTKRDTTKNKVKNNKDVDSKIEYSAQDSTKYSKDKSIIYLYGKARVIYQTFELDADYIRYDSKTNVVFASGRKDAKGKYIGKPIIKMDKDGSSIADSLYYNTKSGKGTIFNTFTEQEGGFFSGGQSKKQPDDEIHVKNMIYSTCNLPHPHFGFFITKGIVTKNQVITGPVYLEIEDIPLPLALPFAFFPKPNKKSSGVIVPNIGEDGTLGFFLRDGGYYIGISDYWDAKILGTIYTRGSYVLNTYTNYMKRYKYNGSINLSYTSTKQGVEGTISNTANKDFHIYWSHSQNPNANPGTTFSAHVDAGTGSYFVNSRNNGNYNPGGISRNALASSVNYGKTGTWYNYNVTLSSSQELQAKTISLTAPSFTFNVQSFNPFDSKTRVGEQKWYQKLNVGYAMQASNTINTTESELFKPDAFKKFQSGMSHDITASLPFTLAKFFNLSISSGYTEQWNFQTYRQTMLKIINHSDSLVYDTIAGFKRFGVIKPISFSASTKIYNTAQFKNLGKIQAIRHVMTPSVSMSYTPANSSGIKELLYQDGTNVYDPIYKQNRTYSIFQGSRFSGSSGAKSATMGFSLNNDVELKVANPKDTTGTGTKKIPIIQGLNFSSGYDFLRPAFKLSNISFSGRSQFTEKIGINFSGQFSPYTTMADTLNTGKRILQDKYTWSNAQLPRLTAFGFSFDYSFNPTTFQKRQDNMDKLNQASQIKGITPEQANALAAISRDPNAFVDFNVPWNLSFSYSFNYNTDDAGNNPTRNSNLTFRGDFSPTNKWKVTYESGYNFQTNKLALTTFTIYRDLHCWDLHFTWVPFGAFKMYQMTLKVKASILQDLKLSKQASSYYNN